MIELYGLRQLAAFAEAGTLSEAAAVSSPVTASPQQKHEKIRGRPRYLSL